MSIAIGRGSEKLLSWAHLRGAPPVGLYDHPGAVPGPRDSLCAASNHSREGRERQRSGLKRRTLWSKVQPAIDIV